MGDRLRAVIFDPETQLPPSLGEALAARRCDAATTRELTGAELLANTGVDLVFFDGAARQGADLCSALISNGITSRPFIVTIVASYAPNVVEDALALGVDDVLALEDLSRLGPLLRHSSRFRRGERDSKSHAPELLEQVSDFVLQLDRDATITFLNRDGVRTVSETVGSSAYDHLPVEWQPGFRKAFDAALATGEPRSYETVSHGRTFRVRIVPGTCDGEAKGATLIATDVTELSSIMRKLRESETHAGAILDALPDLVIRVRDDGRVLDVHTPPRAADGAFPATVTVGKLLSAFLPDSVAQKLVVSVRRAIRTGELDVLTYEIGDGPDRRDFEARIASNGPSEAIVVVRDMTAHNRSRERSTVTERLASLGTMAAGVAHEVNSPLTFVMLGLEWIARQLATLEPGVPLKLVTHQSMTTRVHEVLDGAQRIHRIVRDLKAFTRPDETRAALVDVPSAIDGALSLAAAELRYRARVEKNYGSTPPILGNHARLGQVVLNLLVNAAHALPEDRTSENVVVVRTGVAADGRVCLEVSDNGAGISPEHVLHLFEPFFTTKPVGQGTGLGLWVCHEIVTELGGEIVVESELGKGSTFRVLLPVGEKRSSLPPPSATPPSSLPRARVLVVDDEPNLAHTLARLLDAHSVEVAVGGEAALAAIAKDPEYDLVLCDLMMPGASGMDVHAEVAKRWPYLAGRFVFMTGGAFTPRAKAFLAEVGLPQLEKPFRFEAVTDLLKQKREK